MMLTNTQTERFLTVNYHICYLTNLIHNHNRAVV